MYFDYAVLALMVWGLGDAIFNSGEISDDSDDVWLPDTDEEIDNSGDGSDLLDNDTGDSTDEGVTPAPETTDPTEDLEGGEATPTPDPEPEINEDYVYISGPTTVAVETEGEVSTSVFDDIDYGIAPTAIGTDVRDIIDASDETGFNLNIEAGAGDDTVNFGFGASVNGDEGADILSLTVTQNALASDNDVGQINMTDTADTLSVTFEDETPEFVLTVRGQTVTTVDGVTTQVDWIDYYVSDTEALGEADLAEGSYPATDATRVFRAILGSGAEGATDINDDPAIVLNRTIATQVDLTI